MIGFDAKGSVARQIEKDALLQIVKMRLNDQEGVDVTGLLKVLDGELNSAGNLIVMKRAVELLTVLSDYPEL